MIAHCKFSKMVVVVVHIPLAKPMTSGDDAVPHRHLGGVGVFIANQGRTCILIGIRAFFKLRRRHSFLNLNYYVKVGLG